MSLTKSDISNNIAFRASIPKDISKSLFEKFTKTIIHNTQNKIVKINNFGTFFYKISPQRIGRNPKTGEEHIISRRSKFKFSPSNRIKKAIN